MKFCLSLALLLLALTAQAQPQSHVQSCEQRLLTPVFSEAVLLEKGLNPNDLEFHVKPLDWGEWGPAFKISIHWRQTGVQLATLEIARRLGDNRKLYARTTFSQIYGERENQMEARFKGKGLGSALYLIGARLAREIWGVEMISSLHCSDEATALWMRFVAQGAARIESPTSIGTLGQTFNPDRPNATFKVFNLDKLNAATDPAIRFFLRNLTPKRTLPQLRRELSAEINGEKRSPALPPQGQVRDFTSEQDKSLSTFTWN